MKIEIVQDTDAESPLESDGRLGRIVCWHRRYSLGDEQPVIDPQEWMAENFNDVLVVLPVYMYDHSGITIRTTPFECTWDSGQIGYIYCTKQNAKDCGFPLTEDAIEIITKGLVGEIEMYDQYLRGDVWGFRLLDDDGTLIDSCWGFFGDDPKTNGMADHLPAEVLS